MVQAIFRFLFPILMDIVMITIMLSLRSISRSLPAFAQFRQWTKTNSTSNVFQLIQHRDLQLICSLQSKYLHWYIFSDSWLIRSAATLASTGTATLSDVVGFDIVEVLYQNTVSGELTDITQLWISNECGTTAYSANGKSLNDSSLRTSNCFFATEPTYSRILNRSTSACINAVSQVQYTIYHQNTAESEITNATVKLIITDLDIDQYSTSDIYVTQSFGIQFESSYSQGISQENGNIVKR